MAPSPSRLTKHQRFDRWDSSFIRFLLHHRTLQTGCEDMRELPLGFPAWLSNGTGLRGSTQQE